MFESAAKNLRTNERYLLAPALSAQFGSAPVLVRDISTKGARFTHAKFLEMGTKAMLKMTLDGRASPFAFEAMVVWTEADPEFTGRMVSGVRTYPSAEIINALLGALQASNRTTRIEELRAADRFHVIPSAEAEWNGERVSIDNLCARGVRIATDARLNAGSPGVLRFAHPPGAEAKTHVVWSSIKSVDPVKHRAGLSVDGKSDTMRLAIGWLSEAGQAVLDTQSLALKLKIIRARARQLAPSHRDVEASGVPAEQYILVQCVREELRLNPEEAMHWYRRARLLIQDPKTQSHAPAISSHPDALAVWEYLDRSIDPSIIGRTFQLPAR